jgi:superfamily II DNA or RNA helicase
MKLVPGLYESPITTGLEQELEQLLETTADRTEMTEGEAPQVLARVIHNASVRALRSFPAEKRLELQIALANRVLALLSADAKDSGIDATEALRSPAQMLMALRATAAQRLGTGALARPTLPLRHSDLLVNGPRDLRVGHEVRLELASANRVDLLVSFIRWSGLRLLVNELREFLGRGPQNQVRVMTTTYLGASEPEAIEKLLELGAHVKVSYESRRTRLHAKAWLFHRDSGFSTALVGSSNLSSQALIDGCEWNVRLAAVDNAPILTKFATTFDQYWDDIEFEPYDRERFMVETRRRDSARDALARAVQLRPYPHQQSVLDALALEREHGHTNNLIVAATGTGKTVMAALDYARLRKQWGDPSLLFVAHRREILNQSLATFRAAVRDGHFGELMVGDERPQLGRQVFASIQSLHEKKLRSLAPDAYDVLIVDEFHHAEADTYRALLAHLRPKILLGMTATPERADGQSVLGWFEHRIAAELRLWDALDLGLVVPFQYFGVHDGTDLSTIDFKSGRYDVASLENVYTADDVRAQAVLRALFEHVRDPKAMRALGFCVSIKHAEFMAAFFTAKGIPALAVSGETADRERADALRRLRAGEVNILFSRDLFNEGLDVPSVDTVLFLRPTESSTIFLQQLGRGLRHEEGKACLTVLDFIGNAHQKFRFDDRYRAILGGGTRAGVRRAVEDGFPHLPAGCEIKLDRESQKAVLANIRSTVASNTKELIDEVARLGDVRLPDFLRACEMDLTDLYRDGRTLTGLKHAAKVRNGPPPENEVTRAFERLLHVDDDARLKTWLGWLQSPHAPRADANDPMHLMFFVLLGFARAPLALMQGAYDDLWSNAELRLELADVFQCLADEQRRPTFETAGLPFRLHATYSRDEVSAGLREVRKGKLMRTQGGVYKAKEVRCDILYVTLEKDAKHFTPTTLYDDYPISQSRFHWESQGPTREDSSTGRRYRGLTEQPWRTMLFVRRAKWSETGVTSPYLFLGAVRYVSHESEKPMRITWDLEFPMPAGFFNDVKVAAG